MSLRQGKGRHLFHKEHFSSCSWNFSCTKCAHSAIILKITLFYFQIAER